MTRYVNRVTIAVPDSMMDAANAIAVVFGESDADAYTFTEARYVDASGNQYAVASSVVAPGFIAKIYSPPATLLESLTPEKATAVSQATDALVICTFETPAQASPGKITALLGGNSESAIEHLGLMGLSETTAP